MAEQRKLDVEDRPVAPAAESGERDEAPERESALVPADSLQRYLAEIRRIPILSREEEHELAVRWHEHADRQAAWRLVTSNLRLGGLAARGHPPALHHLPHLNPESKAGLPRAGTKSPPYPGS